MVVLCLFSKMRILVLIARESNSEQQLSCFAKFTELRQAVTWKLENKPDEMCKLMILFLPLFL